MYFLPGCDKSIELDLFMKIWIIYFLLMIIKDNLLSISPWQSIQHFILILVIITVRKNYVCNFLRNFLHRHRSVNDEPLTREKGDRLRQRNQLKIESRLLDREE